ncbi:MAG: molybdopterin-dependent oxidoreductase [Acidobacteriaceae bacterium]|nr:molybdopterin-dependent oxidoreductase [Acidobacteriaceae bacterium]
MERRSFFKILSSVSAGVAASSCSNKTDTLIPLLVSNTEIVPGEEQWHPSVCSECSAGCGVIVRVMEGERTVERQGHKFRERIAAIKKIEGNPLDPVSGGRLCARGQSAVQSLYHPDRVTAPMRRKGTRGTAEFVPVSWDEAIDAVSRSLNIQQSADPGKILFLTRPESGSRSATIQNFLSALNAPPPLTCSLASFAVERKASEVVFGWRGVPVYNLARARYVLGVGADFLGGWVSPVYYARQFGEFRRGRPGVRGRFIQAESRMSLTAASADEWLPLLPGSEPEFLTAVTRLLLDARLARDPEQLPPAVLNSIKSADVASLARICGLNVNRLERITRDLGESDAPLVISGASSPNTNSLHAVAAAHYLNALLGNIGRPGGILAPNQDLSPLPLVGSVSEKLKASNFLLLDYQNPVYSLPAAAGARETLSQLEMIVSFSPFIDDSSAYADWILPDHHALETAQAVVPAVAPGSAITVGLPFIRPLYDTRALDQTLVAIAHKMGKSLEPVTPERYVKSLLPPDQTWDQVACRGGLWQEAPKPVGNEVPRVAEAQAAHSEIAVSPDLARFPFYFQPYLSLQFHDGSGANLPWMQELPDPVSSAMWNIPVEIDPQSAARLDIRTGDWVRVQSPYSSFEAPAYVYPAAIPGVVSMAIGDGHQHYGRYASGRGANPIEILAPVLEPSTGTLALGGTRVQIARLDRAPAGFVQFSPRDREQGPWGYR